MACKDCEEKEYVTYPTAKPGFLCGLSWDYNVDHEEAEYPMRIKDIDKSPEWCLKDKPTLLATKLKTIKKPEKFNEQRFCGDGCHV